MNILKNWSFEDGWTTDPVTGNQTPHDWLLCWGTPGDVMLSAGAFPDEDPPVIDVVEAVPECVHKLQNQLPPDEWLGAEDALILDGKTTYKIFGHAFGATIWQELELTPGATVTFRVPIQAHHHGDGSYGACAARIWINDNNSLWATFGSGFPDPANPAWVAFAASITLPANDGHCRVGIDLEGRAEADVSFFVDAVKLEVIEPVPVCRGMPRIDYQRVYNVIPQDATEERAVEIFRQCWRDGKRTVGGSSDDGGLGDLSNKTAIEWDRPEAQRQAYLDFYAQYYPGTVVEFAGSGGTPEPFRLTYPTTHLPPFITQPFIPGQHGGIDLRSSWDAWGDEVLAAYPAAVVNDTTVLDATFGYQVLTRATTADEKPLELRYAHLKSGVYVQQGATVQRGQKLGKADNTGLSSGDHLHFSVKLAGVYVDPEPLIDWPSDDPDPDGEPPPYNLRSRNHVGLHSGFPRAQSWPYIEQSGVNVQKFFSAGDAYQAGVRAPGIVSIWRKFVGDPGITDPIATQAQWYVDQYTAEINTAAANLGISVETLLSKISAAESLNETIPSNNPTQVQRGVEFDVRFAEKLHARYGDLLAPCLLNVAIGNPLESEVHYLIPAAQAAVEYGGLLGYHSYWTRNETRGFITDYWQWHAGRWMEWDNVFRAAGVYPRYALGEGGIVYAPDGVSFNSGKGWKSCGSFERYLEDIQIFNERVKAWNAQHANRCAGLAIFGYGSWGWNDFELGDGEVILLNQWAQGAQAMTASVSFDVGMQPQRADKRADKRAYYDALKKYLAETPYIPDENRRHLEETLAQLRTEFEAAP